MTIFTTMQKLPLVLRQAGMIITHALVVNTQLMQKNLQPDTILKMLPPNLLHAQSQDGINISIVLCVTSLQKSKNLHWVIHILITQQSNPHVRKMAVSHIKHVVNVLIHHIKSYLLQDTTILIMKQRPQHVLIMDGMGIIHVAGVITQHTQR